MSSPLDKISDVDIDVGKFKYILIKAHHSPASGDEDSKFIVRGYGWAEYHADIYDKVTSQIEAEDMECECVGGGRILHKAEEKTINVYGYSQGYGKADHSISCELIKEKYPEHKVTWSNEGY